ncbi:MAG: Holliday junction resolvase RuvX [Pseudomonadota bacterium]
MNSIRELNRVLAFDYGLRQIGVAVGSTFMGTTQPLPILLARDGVPSWTKVSTLLTEWQPDHLLVGDPINMDGTPSVISLRALKFARRLEGRFKIGVTLVDERLTSFAVKHERSSNTDQRQSRGRGLDFKKDPVDSLAAELILKDWMNTRASV